MWEWSAFLKDTSWTLCFNLALQGTTAGKLQSLWFWTCVLPHLCMFGYWKVKAFLIGLFFFFLFNWKRRCVSWLVCLTLLLNEAKRHCYNNGNLARASCCRQHPAVGAGRDFPLPSHQWETGFPMFSTLAHEKCVVLKKEATCPCLLNDPGSTPSCFQTRPFSSFKAMCEKPVIHL